MTAARWEQLKDLFEAALERSAADRAAFIQHVCGVDGTLRAELESLLVHHEGAGPFLQGATHPPEFSLAEGTFLGGRFRVIRPLGRGGMGEVYEVYNQHTQQSEALKILRPELAQDRDNVARLVQEIQLARRVTHANVCRVFDLQRDTYNGHELVFLTMELLSGETLAEHLRRQGPLSRDYALALATQIAAGLDHAHKAGVIHRDFKTANVMIEKSTGGERAVIMDFGLARTEQRPDLSLTATGVIAGTPAYMAPEQLAGVPVNSAADIYAFGIVLFEIRTNSRPSAPAAGIKLDPAWSKAVARCLDRDPQRRPLSAADAIRPLAAPRRPMSRFAWAAAFLVLALFALFVRLLFHRHLAAEGATVMLADIQNATSYRELDGATEAFRSQLEQSGYFHLWDRARLPAALERMALPRDGRLSSDRAREVALREGVPLVVFGTISSLAGDLLVTVRLDVLGSTGPFAHRSWSHSVRAGGIASLHDAIHDSAAWLRSTLGESASDIAAHDRLPQDTTSSSWEALAAFAEAQRLWQAKQPDTAVALLREALRRDPDFALARMRLGDNLVSLRKDQEGYEQWQLALQAGARRRLALREELLLQGSYSDDTWDFPAAEAAFVRMESGWPHDYLASFYLGHALRWQGRLEESARKFESADAKQPNSSVVLSNLAGVYDLLQRYDDLDHVIARLRALPRLTAADRYLGLKNFALGKYDDALADFDKCTASTDPEVRSRGYSDRASLLAELGRYGEARDSLSAGMRLDSAAGRHELHAAKSLALAYLAARQNRRREAVALAWDAVGEDASPYLRLRAAIIFASMGAIRDAQKLASDAARVAPGSVLNRVIQSRIRGEIELARGNAVGAVAEFRQTVSLSPALRPRDYLARALSADGNFEEAAAIWRSQAEQPELLWQATDYDFPGCLTDALFDYVQAAFRVGRAADARSALKLYLERRGNSGLPEAAAAKKLRAGLSLLDSKNHP